MALESPTALIRRTLHCHAELVSQSELTQLRKLLNPQFMLQMEQLDLYQHLQYQPLALVCQLVVWRYIMMEYGVLCVMTVLIRLMLM